MANNAGVFRKHVRSQREVQLVQAATSLLLRKGCQDFRVADVTRACGVAKGTSYRHFDAQDDLIAAAVRSLDEALAARLLAPPPRLTKPRQALNWAYLEVVEAQIFSCLQRSAPAEPDADTLPGKAWPCCLRMLPCPHGGAAQSSKALLRWTTARTSETPARSSLQLRLLLALVPTYCFSLDHNGNTPHPRTIRAVARQLFTRLFSPGI